MVASLYNASEKFAFLTKQWDQPIMQQSKHDPKMLRWTVNMDDMQQGVIQGGGEGGISPLSIMTECP